VPPADFFTQPKHTAGRRQGSPTKKRPEFPPGVFKNPELIGSAGVELDDELLVDERVDLGAFWNA
jgi:hypothetical protein